MEGRKKMFDDYWWCNDSNFKESAGSKCETNQKIYLEKKMYNVCAENERERELFFVCRSRSIDRCGSFLRVVDVATSLTQRRIPSITYLNSPAYICIKSMPADVCGSEFLCFNSKPQIQKWKISPYTQHKFFGMWILHFHLSCSLSLSFLYTPSFSSTFACYFHEWKKRRQQHSSVEEQKRERERERGSSTQSDDSIQNNI